MPSYSIKDLEVISGIKAHTIRIWEQRYGLLEPQRTETNIRLYDDNQMRRLLNVSALLETGLRVSKIAHLSDDDLCQRVQQLIVEDNKDLQIVALINEIIKSGLTYDRQMFDKAFDAAEKKFGLKDTFINIIYPTLIRIGFMWMKQDMIPAQEHFISSLIKQKLFSAINEQPTPAEDAEKWVLLLPDDEDHEIGLLFSHFLLSQKGKNVIYLGQRVPYSNIESIIAQEQPDCIHFFMIKNQSVAKAQNIVEKMVKITGKSKVIVSGSKFLESELELPKNYKWLNCIDSFAKM